MEDFTKSSYGALDQVILQNCTQRASQRIYFLGLSGKEQSSVSSALSQDCLTVQSLV